MYRFSCFPDVRLTCLTNDGLLLIDISLIGHVRPVQPNWVVECSAQSGPVTFNRSRLSSRERASKGDVVLSRHKRLTGDIEIEDDMSIKLIEVKPLGQFNGELGGPINITISVRLSDAAKEGDKQVITVTYGTQEKQCFEQVTMSINPETDFKALLDTKIYTETVFIYPKAGIETPMEGQSFTTMENVSEIGLTDRLWVIQMSYQTPDSVVADNLSTEETWQDKSFGTQFDLHWPRSSGKTIKHTSLLWVDRLRSEGYA
ncbi:unnamed protein product [Echinostoma caproni]|uniref:FRAS1-related extracellular matrix protein 2 n=1 Tax=Echinostoma caproni TaxID=27848 RepID=A0A183B2S0_9TREM|nr:unnamed protein product [Echinostoma caproni]